MKIGAPIPLYTPRFAASQVRPAATQPRFAAASALPDSAIGLLNEFAGNIYKAGKGVESPNVIDWLVDVKAIGGDKPQGVSQDQMLDLFCNEGSKKRGRNIIPPLVAEGLLIKLAGTGNFQLSPTVLPHLTDAGLAAFKAAYPSD